MNMLITPRVYLAFGIDDDVTQQYQQNGYIYDLHSAKVKHGIVFAVYYVRGYVH